MAETSRKQVPGRRKRDQQHEQLDSEPTPSSSAMGEELDSILDEIDEVLEENAEEFVKSYVQKGGE